jgi:hypothetical protein
MEHRMNQSLSEQPRRSQTAHYGELGGTSASTAPAIMLPSYVYWARVAYTVTAWLFVASVAAQVFLAGMATFVDPVNWAQHKSFVHVFEGLPLLMLGLGFAGRMLRWQPVVLFLLIAAQYATVEIGRNADMRIVGALHPVNALLIFWLALSVAQQAWAMVRQRSE